MENEEIERIARRRAGAKMGWYIHAVVYILVNVMLASLAAMAGRSWAVFPAFGWGLGLAIHGIVTFIALLGEGYGDRMLADEVERVRSGR